MKIGDILCLHFPLSLSLKCLKVRTLQPKAPYIVLYFNQQENCAQLSSMNCFGTSERVYWKIELIIDIH